MIGGVLDHCLPSTRRGVGTTTSSEDSCRRVATAAGNLRHESRAAASFVFVENDWPGAAGRSDGPATMTSRGLRPLDLQESPPKVTCWGLRLLRLQDPLG
jgi:hypothetical protein